MTDQAYGVIISMRLTSREKDGLDAFLNNINHNQGKTMKRSEFLRTVIRNLVGLGPDFYPVELYLLKELHLSLTQIGINLNQLMRAIHQGKLLNRSFTSSDLDQLRRLVDDEKCLLRTLLNHSNEKHQSMIDPRLTMINIGSFGENE